ncbi:Bax inhibitor-1/YccA family protein [bacterium]|nr:MAG: Bax inhibitor-1/YccA family protein [bacterium]
MRTSNPAINEKVFSEVYNTASGDSKMTIEGTVNKSFLLLLLVFTGASLTWHPEAESVSGLMFLGMIGGLITGFITIFKKNISMYTAPLYALFEGLFLGGISSIFEASFPGVVIQAILLTFGTAGGLLLAYKSGLIPVTENFKLGIVAATGGIAITYFFSWILGMFGIDLGLGINGGIYGILFNLFVVVIAALNLVLDFDFIEEASKRGAPKFMEWYASFGLMVTLIWLYLEFLKLIARLQSRD